MAYYSERDPPFVRTKMEKKKLSRKKLGPQTDLSVFKELTERLRSLTGVDTTDIDIEVRRGKAVLRGTVPSERIKKFVEDVSNNHQGVRQVESHLTVAVPLKPRTGGDKP